MKFKAHAAVLLGNFFFGVGVVAIKHLVPSVMKPLGLNVLRVGVALILFWLLYILNPSGKPGIQKKDVKLFIICGLCGIVINQILFVKGTALTSPIHASLLSLSTPIVIFCISIIFFSEKLSALKIAGLAAAIFGAALLIFNRNNNSQDGSSMLGDVLVIINACSYSVYLVLAKPLMQTYKPIHVTRWVFLIGACCILPIGVNDFLAIQWQDFTATHWIALVFIVIGATFLSYLIMVYGIAHLGSTITGMYIYTQPVFATIAAIVLFGEKLSVLKICAALCIFAGVYLVGKKGKDLKEDKIRKL